MSGPLKSWDIFMDSYWRGVAGAQDITLLNDLAQRHQWATKLNFYTRLLHEKQVVVITDLTQKIVFASNDIYAMTGYLPEEILGNTPRMFQGAGTDPAAKDLIRTSIQKGTSFQISLLNYRKNGTTYNCHIEGHPIYNASNVHTHFVAFERVAYAASAR